VQLTLHALFSWTRRVSLHGCTAAMLAGLAACGGGGGDGGSDSSGNGNTPPPPADMTAPVLSAMAANTTATSATISWTTSEPADSQVEYGPTVAYGSASAVDSTMTANHTVTLNALTAGTAYHYRVKSHDAAGNLATGSDLTFTTAAAADTTPPTLTISAPSANATLSGTISVAANATDDIGIAGVQFQIDGSSLGAEDTSAPYETSWNTTTAANGAHVLTAVARDAAGNQATSAGVSVTVNNAPPPNDAAIDPGPITVDPPTLQTLGVSLSIGTSDTNHNATVTVQFRRTGDSVWRDAMPLFRLRPELLSEEDPTPFIVAEQFAGSLFDLDPDTEYEILLTIQDPDGGNTIRTVTARTRAEPAANPATPHAVTVSTLPQLNAALDSAQAGDVITLLNGTYGDSISISRSGTAANPIFIRGESRDGVIIDAAGSDTGVRVTGSYVTVENLTIRGSTRGMYLNDDGGTSSNVVVRRVRITDVSYGIEALSGTKRDYYICDNTLEGRAVWPQTDSSVWDLEGIVVVGSGHVVCYNTISGFGDALSMHHDTDVPNRANDFYGNDVLWTGDNGIELDFGERNVRALRNRFTNGGNQSMSFQPIYGGPAYAIRNVIYNSAASPFKFNNEPTGMVVLHNTALRPGIAWSQLGQRADNFIVANNLFIGTGQPTTDITTTLSLAQIDYNGYWPDGSFRFSNQLWNTFADLSTNSPYEHNGRLLNGLPFASAISIPASYTTRVDPPEIALSASSNAIDGGLRLPNVNDAFAGANPDLGALELGATPPHYGVR
jgi:Big-like domain-containing protein/purple acid phosphatase-like protein/chondroitinase B-like protein